jgi:hypothetical protein
VRSPSHHNHCTVSRVTPKAASLDCLDGQRRQTGPGVALPQLCSLMVCEVFLEGKASSRPRRGIASLCSLMAREVFLEGKASSRPRRGIASLCALMAREVFLEGKASSTDANGLSTRLLPESCYLMQRVWFTLEVLPPIPATMTGEFFEGNSETPRSCLLNRKCML